MNKNTSPQARSSKKSRSQRRDSVTPASPERVKSKTNGSPERTDFMSRLREFLPMVMINNVIIVSFLILLALATLLLTNSSFVALPATIAQLWLLFNASPVASPGAELGFVPLVPATIVIALGAWRVYSVVKEKVSLADLYVLVACVVVVPLLLTLTAVAMLFDASSVLPVALPSIPVALGRTALIQLLAFVIGMGPRLWRALERRYAPGSALLETAVLALKFWGWMLAVSGLVFIILLATHWETVKELYVALDQPGSAAGLTGISLMYLPNFLIIIALILTGSEFSIADGSVSLFGSYLVPLPPLPILAVVPGSVWPQAWALLLVPVVVAAVVLYRYVGKAERPFRDVAHVGLWVAAMAAIAVILVSGQMGGYGLIGPVWWLTIALAPVWVWGAGFVTAAIRWVIDYRTARSEGVDAYEYEPDRESSLEPDFEVDPPTDPADEPEYDPDATPEVATEAVDSGADQESEVGEGVVADVVEVEESNSQASKAVPVKKQLDKDNDES